MLVQLGISFQRSMYNVTSAVIQAGRSAFLYPLDDSNLEHLQANRRYFQGQLNRFCNPNYGMDKAAKLEMIQNQNYR